MSKDIAEKTILPGILEEFRSAIRDEIASIEKNGQSSTLLISGKRISSNSGEFWYRFQVEYAPNMPADTPCKLTIGKNHYDVTVIGFEENELTISSPVELPDTLAKAQLENGATILMERLIKRIEENSEKENCAWNRILTITDGNPVEKFSCIEPRINIEYQDKRSNNQKKAVESSIKNDITYIWGPPGTGKTTVIGDIIEQLYKKERTVFVVSHTNTAVDGAIRKVQKLNKTEKGSCPVLRIGITKDLDDSVKLESHVKVLGEELYNRQQELKKQQDEENKQITAKSILIAKLDWVANCSIEQIKTKEKRVELLTQQRDSEKSLCSELNSKILSISAQHKEIKEYDGFKEKQLSLQSKIAGLSKERESLSRELNGLEESYKEADREIHKHYAHKKLNDELSTYMPADFIRNLILENDEKLKELHKEQEKIEEQIEKNEAIILRKSRNAISNFLSRGSIQQTESELALLKNEKEKTVLELQRIDETKKSYENKLIQRAVLEQQIKDVQPSKTVTYWEDEFSRIAQTIERKKAETVAREKEIHTNTETLNAIEAKLRQFAPIHNELIQLRAELNDSKEKLETVTASLSACMEDLQKLLDLEYSSSSLFGEDGITPNGSVNEQVTALANLYNTISQEVQTLDHEQIRVEIEAHQKKVTEIKTELKSIDEKIANLERQAIIQAKIIGATLTNAYLKDSLQGRDFDTVILDEASMAPIPALWCASLLSKRNIIIVGDFLQLPPIAMADTPMAKKWLGRDIFAASGMQERAKKGNLKPENFIMLDEQFRMEKEIADIANLYYGDYALLRSTNENSEDRQEERKKFYSWYKGAGNRSVEVIDTSDLNAWVTTIPRGKKASRLNCFSAALVVEMAFQWLQDELEAAKNEDKIFEKPKVLIVAPYRPHIDRVNQLIQFEYKLRGLDDPNLIKAGTIHSFQGNEADIVIFDLVLDAPHWRANLFLPDNEVNEELQKQFNVAITRAKFKLFIVGNIQYCRQKAKNNALGQLLNYLDHEKFPIINAKKAFPDLLYAKPRTYIGNELDDTKHIICREDTFDHYFISDVCNFKNNLIIYSPFFTSARIALLLPYFHDAIKNNRRITVVTKALNDRKKSELDLYKELEAQLRDTRVEIIHKKGMHEKLVFVDDSIVWMGSLNVLSFSGATGEIMHRHCDKSIAAEYKKIYDIPYIQAAIETTNELICPICRCEMQLYEGNNGVYWKCIRDDYSRNKDQLYPYDGILRCHCGGDYHYVMKKEPRWVCDNNPQHYQQIRKGDLQMEKMAAKIPTAEDRQAIEEYFAKKAGNDKNKSGTNLKDKGTKHTGAGKNSDYQYTLF